MATGTGSGNVARSACASTGRSCSGGVPRSKLLVLAFALAFEAANALSRAAPHMHLRWAVVAAR